jgi:hypothetical protein
MQDQPEDTSSVWEFTTVTVTPSPEVLEAVSKIPGLAFLVGVQAGEPATGETSAQPLVASEFAAARKRPPVRHRGRQAGETPR